MNTGDWRQQLDNLCKHIRERNRTKTAGQRDMKVPSEYEWWAWWGIIFSACPAGKSGKYLFNKAPFQFKSLVLRELDFGKNGLDVMEWHRFKALREVMHFAFYDHTCPEDPYHPVKLLIDGYNDNRTQKIAAAIVIVLDESMSNFKPRTTATSKLPNISFIFRKPKPIGLEFKVSFSLLVVPSSRQDSSELRLSQNNL